MTVPLTIVTPQRTVDVVLPAQIPLAVIEHDLADLLRVDQARLRTLGGQALDPALSLAENGALPGAVLLAAAHRGGPLILDDVADLTIEPELAAPSSAARVPAGVLLGVALVVVGAVPAVAPTAAAWIALAALLVWQGTPRVVLRRYRLDPDDDPRDPGAVARIRLAQRRTLQAQRVAAAGGLVAGLWLIGSGSILGSGSVLWSLLAGWLLITLGLLRSHLRDGLLSAGAVLCAVAGVALTVREGGWPQILTGCGCALVLLAVLREPARPVARLAHEALQTTLTAVLPAGLLVCTGIVPGIGP